MIFPFPYKKPDKLMLQYLPHARSNWNLSMFILYVILDMIAKKDTSLSCSKPIKQTTDVEWKSRSWRRDDSLQKVSHFIHEDIFDILWVDSKNTLVSSLCNWYQTISVLCAHQKLRYFAHILSHLIPSQSSK